jgi:hypothetical protein
MNEMRPPAVVVAIESRFSRRRRTENSSPANVRSSRSRSEYASTTRTPLRANLLLFHLSMTILFLLTGAPAARGWSCTSSLRSTRRKLLPGSTMFRTTTLFSSTSSSTEVEGEASAPAKSKRPSRILSGVQPTGSLHLGNYLGKKPLKHTFVLLICTPLRSSRMIQRCCANRHLVQRLCTWRPVRTFTHTHTHIYLSVCSWRYVVFSFLCYDVTLATDDPKHS